MDIKMLARGTGDVSFPSTRRARLRDLVLGCSG